jgi:hypothetical protein
MSQRDCPTCRLYRRIAFSGVLVVAAWWLIERWV